MSASPPVPPLPPLDPAFADLPLQRMPWVALDLEMTGLDLANDRICEIGWVGWDGPREVERDSRLVNPGVRVSARARRIHGLDDEVLGAAAPFEAVADAVHAALDGRVVVAHGAKTDRAFLEAAFARLDRAPPRVAWFDTLRITRRLYALHRNGLGHAARALGVVHGDAHRALGDALAAAGILRGALPIVDPEGTLTLGGLSEHLDDLRLGSPARRAQRRVIETALRSRRSLLLRYLSHDRETAVWSETEREVEVWRVRWPRFQAWCRLRQAPRVFRLPRVRHVEVGGDPVTIPAFAARI